jgi:hypothetical protein
LGATVGSDGSRAGGDTVCEVAAGAVVDAVVGDAVVAVSGLLAIVTDVGGATTCCSVWGTSEAGLGVASDPVRAATVGGAVAVLDDANGAKRGRSGWLMLMPTVFAASDTARCTGVGNTPAAARPPESATVAAPATATCAAIRRARPRRLGAFSIETTFEGASSDTRVSTIVGRTMPSESSWAKAGSTRTGRVTAARQPASAASTASSRPSGLRSTGLGSSGRPGASDRRGSSGRFIGLPCVSSFG